MQKNNQATFSIKNDGKIKKIAKKNERKNLQNNSRTQEKDKPIWQYILTGLCAGIANGLFGGGGGMIVVPMLTYLLKMPPKNAHATALFVILPLSIISGIFYAVIGSYELSSGIPTTIGVIAGGVIGAFLLSKITSKWLMIIFALVMAFAGGKMLFF